MADQQINVDDKKYLERLGTIVDKYAPEHAPIVKKWVDGQSVPLSKVDIMRDKLSDVTFLDMGYDPDTGDQTHPDQEEIEYVLGQMSAYIPSNEDEE
jgi:hypothetical protein